MFDLVRSLGVTINNIKTKMNTTEVTVNEALKIAVDLYDKALSKKKILAMIAAAICLLLLIIIIAANASGSDAEPQTVTTVLEDTATKTTVMVIIPQACHPSLDEDCVG